MLKAVIIEDEANSRQVLASLINRYCPEVTIIGEGSDIDGGKEEIINKRPDLVFLDIEMPGGSGFEVLEDLKDFEFEVIFTTAYDEYAIKAIKFSALDYLLKPINIEELKEAVQKAKSRLDEKDVGERYNLLLSNLKEGKDSNQKIILTSADGSTFVKVKDLLRCEAAGSYTTFYLLNEEKVFTTKSIGEAEELLKDFGFFRVHKSHLVNLDYIKHYKKGVEGYIILEDDTEIKVSRRKKDVLLDKLNML